jgi:heme/copper-type cytochrome/quinol oxidase subunit 3
MLIFLAAEAMFFAGLIGAFLVFRFGSATWPPPGQPYLPVGVTGVNTIILLVSAYTMGRALRAIRRGDRRGLVRGLLVTALLGTIFLGVQGYEWIRLVHFGFTVSSGTYGATFYTLIGIHGLHVFGAVLWLLVVLAGARAHRFSATRHAALTICGMYWYFVVALWPVLFGLVYLS